MSTLFLCLYILGIVRYPTCGMFHSKQLVRLFGCFCLSLIHQEYWNVQGWVSQSTILPLNVRTQNNNNVVSLFLSSGSTFSYSNLPEDDVQKIRTIGGPKADIYGEMTERGLRQFMMAVSATKDDIFLDLGSGKGSLVIQAAQEFGQKSMGIELSTIRHEEALENLQFANTNSNRPNDVLFFCGDAAGEDAQHLLSTKLPTIVWCSNLLFDQTLQERLAHTICTHGTNVRAVASLKAFPNGIPGMQLQKFTTSIEMSWTANKEQKGHPPLPGHPCSIYLSNTK